MRPGRLGQRKRKRRRHPCQYFALLSVRIFKNHEDFGLRWQPAEAKRSEDWGTAARSASRAAGRDTADLEACATLVTATPHCVRLRRWLSAEEPLDELANCAV